MGGNMLVIGILFVSIMGQTIYAAHKEERRLVRQYPSYKKRLKLMTGQAKGQVALVEQLGAEKVFERNPRAYLLYQAEAALVNKQIPLESPPLTEQIHGFKRLQPHVSATSSSSVGAKITPVASEPVPVVFHVDLTSTPPQEPSLCSNCVIL